MDLLLIVAFFAIVEGAVIVVSWKDVKRTLYILINKTKGVKQILFLRGDKTVERMAQKPIGKNIKLDDHDYLMDNNAIMFDRDLGIQTLLIKEGDQKIFNPFAKAKDAINPEILKAALMAYYNLGRETAENENKMLKKLVIITAVAAGAAALMGFLNLQAIGDLTAAAANTGVMLG